MSIHFTVPPRFKLWLKARFFEAQLVFVRALRSYDADRLLVALRSLGVRDGDNVMLHAAFGRQHGFRGTVEQLTNVFIDAVGSEGNLLMVSLPYRSSSLQYLRALKRFDVRKTPSMMGLVSEFFRRREDVLRSLHPTHPVLVRGPRADWFVAEHPSCLYPCGPGTPFDRLASVDGKVLFFNVAFDNYTFFHYLEHMVAPELPFSLYTEAPFEVPVVDRDGAARTVMTYAFAEEAIRRRRFPVFEQALRERGLIQERRVGNSRILAVRVRDTVDCVREMARRGEYFYDLEAPKPG